MMSVLSVPSDPEQTFRCGIHFDLQPTILGDPFGPTPDFSMGLGLRAITIGVCVSVSLWVGDSVMGWGWGRSHPQWKMISIHL